MANSKNLLHKHEVSHFRVRKKSDKGLLNKVYVRIRGGDLKLNSLFCSFFRVILGHEQPTTDDYVN